MPLEPGTRLGPYEITGALGAGGMGEVYRARDTKLNRDVAIKVMSEDLANDSDRLARFQREAEALAALNHPNIAQVYGLEQSGEMPAIVMELVEGATLQEAIREKSEGRSQKSEVLEWTLPIARQIVDALEAAHERGIVHRDLKPANIKIRDDGTVKVLDFGLAKAFGPDGAHAAPDDLANSPTMTARATQMGLILGTAAYMAPEQARGKPVDKRADVWAFGVVLFEMLTGRPPFDGSDLSEVMARVIDRDPDWSALPDATPPAVRRLLRRCLVKSPKERLRDIGDARLDIADALAGVGTDTDPASAVHPSAATIGPSWTTAVVAAGVVALVASVGTWLAARPAPPPAALPMEFDADLPEGVAFSATSARSIAISPDGSRIAFAAGRQLWVRPIDGLGATPIPGTRAARTPFFSPDGQELGFWAENPDQLKRVAITGGVPVPVGPASSPFGASWADDGMIYFGQGEDGIWRVPAAGGAPERVIDVADGERAHGPQLLPGGDWVLFTLRAIDQSWSGASIVAESLSTGDRVELVSGGTDGRWVPTGHLVYVSEGTLFGVAFDPARMERPSGPASIRDGIMTSFVSMTGDAHFGFASNGTLVYLPGTTSTDYQLVWMDRRGQVEPLPFDPRNSSDLDLAPDGRHVALEIAGADGRPDIWIYDLTRASAVRLTNEHFNTNPVWSPDGEWVYFSSRRGGNSDIWRQRVDGSLDAELVLDADEPVVPASVRASTDGDRLLFTIASESQNGGILTVGSGRQPDILLESPANEVMRDFSPDGRFILFFSDETGNAEIYAMEVASGRRFQVSSRTHGGLFGRWSRDGREIYLGGSGRLLVASVTAESYSASAPVELPYIPQRGFANFDVSADGQRFLVTTFPSGVGLESASAIVRPRIRVVVNWFEELKARVSGR